MELSNDGYLIAQKSFSEKKIILNITSDFMHSQNGNELASMNWEARCLI